MCGISGVVGLNNILDELYHGIRNLEYRGYDSCGVALMDDKSLTVRKDIGGVEDFFRNEKILSLSSKVGIAHTRWATHGTVTKDNTHPFTSCDGNFAVVHNGIISNFRALKEELAGEGHRFHSGTDTEVIPHLLEKYYNLTGDLEKALVKVNDVLEGTFALAFISPLAPGQIYCAKRESPLILGISAETNFVGSDFNAFIDYTKNAVIIDDGEYAIVSSDSYVVKSFVTMQEVEKTITKIDWDNEGTKKSGYPHYMIKEIYEQPQVVNNALGQDPASLDELADMILESNKTMLVGVGTTYYVASYGSYIFSSLAKEYYPPISSDEFSSLANVDENSLVLALSQSGETYDTLTALKYAHSKGAKTAAIVNVMGSSISRFVDKIILQGSGPEICVISTKAALSQMLILTLVALRVGLKKGVLSQKAYNKSMAALKELPNIIESILNERFEFIHRIAHRYSKTKHWLYLGRGIYYPIAMELALKMKEVAYVHAEGMPGGFLKHGTLAMIDQDIFSIVFIPPREDKDLYDSTILSVDEIRARSGFVLGIHFDELEENKDLFSEELILPKVPPLIAPLIQMVIGQLFSYYTATSLKRNVDKPRFLAKSVTVG